MAQTQNLCKQHIIISCASMCGAARVLAQLFFGHSVYMYSYVLQTI